MNHNFGAEEIAPIAEALLDLGGLAMKFGRINRTCVAHTTGEPESDTDHTLMLAWLAPPLAEMINLRSGYEKYPVAKVTQYAVVHDACEVYAGDTPTIRISAAELEDKEKREAVATARLYQEFIKRLPWFARWTQNYERQGDPAARFVRSVDKILPKIVHVLNRGQDLFRVGLSLADFEALYLRQRQQIEAWCPEPLLLHVYDVLCSRVIDCYHGVFTSRHVLVVDGTSPWASHVLHPGCSNEDDCPVQIAADLFAATVIGEPLTPGRYEVTADVIGQLTFLP